jgi:hypothetical protein
MVIMVLKVINMTYMPARMGTKGLEEAKDWLRRILVGDGLLRRERKTRSKQRPGRDPLENPECRIPCDYPSMRWLGGLK